MSLAEYTANGQKILNFVKRLELEPHEALPALLMVAAFAGHSRHLSKHGFIEIAGTMYEAVGEQMK